MNVETILEKHDRDIDRLNLHMSTQTTKVELLIATQQTVSDRIEKLADVLEKNIEQQQNNFKKFWDMDRLHDKVSELMEHNMMLSDKNNEMEKRLASLEGLELSRAKLKAFFLGPFFKFIPWIVIIVSGIIELYIKVYHKIS